jgi:hypothetical protein
MVIILKDREKALDKTRQAFLTREKSIQRKECPQPSKEHLQEYHPT